MVIDGAIRRAAVGDEEALALLGRATFLEAFADVLRRSDLLAYCRSEHSEAKYRHWLEDGQESSTVFLAEEAFGSPIGYAVLIQPELQLPDLDATKDIELKRLYVLHRYHGTGLGAALMDAVAEAHSLGRCRLLLWVYEENRRALAFYAKSGFMQLAEQPIQVGDTRYGGYVLGLIL